MGSQVAILLHASQRGGAERALTTVAETLARRGVPVEVVLMTGHWDGLAPAAGVPRETLGARRVATSVPHLARYLSRSRPAAVLSTLTHANVAALAARRLSRTTARVVLNEQCLLSSLGVAAHRRRDRLFPPLAARTYAAAEAIACVSEGLAQDVARVTGVAEDRIEVIPNPLSVAHVRAAAREEPDHDWLVDGGPPVVLAVGRLEAVKGFDALIRAFASLTTEARLVVIGEGRERGRLEGLAARLGVAGRVSLPGHVSNPYAYMGRAAVVALSSVREGLPTVLVEALALSRRVVAFDCEAGPREILEGGRLGALVPPGDEPALARAIDAALATGPASIPTEALARYDPERVAGRYLELLAR